jgi:hypothetical protein
MADTATSSWRPPVADPTAAFYRPPVANAPPPDWPKLYGGLDDYEQHLDPLQRGNFDRLTQLSSFDKETKAMYVNRQYVLSQAPKLGINPEMVKGSWPEVRNQAAKSMGYSSGEPVTDQWLYNKIRDSFADEAEIKANLPELKNKSWVDQQMDEWGRKRVEALPLKQWLEKSAVDLPEAPHDLPWVSGMGWSQPALIAGIYNGLFKPVVEGSLTPPGVAAFALGGPALEGRAIARSISGLFGSMMAYNALESAPEALRILNDPGASASRKIEAASAQARDWLLGFMGFAGAVHSAKPKMVDVIARKNPPEVSELLRNAAEQEEDPEIESRMIALAEHLEKLPANETIPPELAKDLVEKTRQPGEAPVVKDNAHNTNRSNLTGIIDQMMEKLGGESLPRVSSPAVRTGEGEIFTGLNHGSIRETQGLGEEGESGFLLDDGTFVGRTEAAAIAKNADQLTPEAKAENPSELHSEHLRPGEPPAVSDLQGVPVEDVSRAIEAGAQLIRDGVVDLDAWQRHMMDATGIRDVLALRPLAEALAREDRPPTTKEVVDMVNGVNREKPKVTLTQKQFYATQDKAGRAGRSEERDALTGIDREAREDFGAIRKTLNDIAMQLPKEERGKFLRAINQALDRPALLNSREGMYSKTMEVALRMLARMDEVEKRSIVEEIQKVGQRVAESQTVDIKYKTRVAEALKGLTFGLTDKKRFALQRRLEYMQAAGEGHGLQPEHVKELELLSRERPEEMPIQVLRALRDQMVEMEKQGKVMRKLEEAKTARETAAWSEDIKASKGHHWDDRPMKASRGEKLTSTERFQQDFGNHVRRLMNWAGTVNRALMVSDVWRDMMDGGQQMTGAIQRYFGWKPDKAHAYKHALMREARESVKEALGKEKWAPDELERVSIWGLKMRGDTDATAHMLDSGVKPETIENIQLTPKEMRLYTAMRKVYDEKIFPAVQQVMADVYNVDVQKAENYWPLQRDLEMYEKAIEKPRLTVKGGEQLGYDELGLANKLMDDFSPQRTTEAEKGFTKSVSEKGQGAVKLNALELFDQHIEEGAHLVSHQKMVKQLGEIAREKWFQEKYGRNWQRQILDYLDILARNGSPKGAHHIRWADSLTRNTSVGVLGLRAFSQLKHLPNVAFSLKNVRADFLTHGFAEFATDAGRAFVEKHFPEIAQRFAGETSIMELGEKGLWQKAQKGSFVLERALDAANARATVLGRYFQELNALGIDYHNYADLPFHEEAGAKALQISRQSVTSPLLKDVPMAISRGALTGKNMTAARALFQFQTTMLRQANYMMYDIGKLGIHDMNLKQFVAASLPFLAMLYGESQIVAMNREYMGNPNTKHDGDNVAKEMANEALKRVPFAGNLIAAATYKETGIPIVDTAMEGWHGLAEFGGAPAEYGRPATAKDRGKGLRDAARLAAEATGIPGAATAFQLYENKYLKSKRDPWTKWREQHEQTNR